MHSLCKVSANPKLTLLHNFGFLYDLRNIRNSFRLEKNPQKCYSYGKLLSENNSAILIILISRWQLLSSRCQIRRGHVCQRVCVFHKITRLAILEALKVIVLKKKKISFPFSSSKPRPKKGKKAFSCEAVADLASSNKGLLSSTKTNGYKKAKNMNANWLQVKSSRISPASLLTWTEFWEKDARSKTFHLHHRQCLPVLDC